MNNVNKFKRMHLQWFADEPAKTEPVKDEPIKEPDKVIVNAEFIDNLYKDYPQVIEKWIVDSPIPKKVLAPWKDSHVSQGLNTFKEKSVPQLIQDAENKLRDSLSPVKTPEMQRIIALEEKSRQDEQRAQVAEISAQAANYVSQLGFDLGQVFAPSDFLKESAEKTVEFIDKLRELTKYYEEKGKKTFIKDNSHTPKDGGDAGIPFDGDPDKYAKAIKEGKTTFSQEVMDKIKAHMYRKK